MKKNIAIKESIQLLKQLSNDYPIAIVSGSNRHHLKEFIGLLNIEKEIKFFLGSEDYINGKPDPEPYLKAAKKLNLDPEQCLVFEDSTAGVNSARQAGMFCVGLEREGTPVPEFRKCQYLGFQFRGFYRYSLSYPIKFRMNLIIRIFNMVPK